MNFYISTGWQDRQRARTLAGILTSWGHKQTYDWTHTDELGTLRFPEIAETEIDAVARADVLIVLLPGERGTHTELGAALALDKPVILWMGDTLVWGPEGTPRVESRDEREPEPGDCPFYWHRNVTRVGGKWPDLVKWLEREFGEVSP